MKKLIAFILLFALLATTASAEIDLSGMTEKELLDLNHQIQILLFGQKLADGVKVHPGKYTVGVDLPAGTYRLAFPGLSELAVGTVYISNASGDFVASHIIAVEVGTSEIGKIELSDGDVIEINGVSPVFYSYAGIFN